MMLYTYDIMLLHIYICMFVYHYVYMHVCYDILIYIVGVGIYAFNIILCNIEKEIINLN